MVKSKKCSVCNQIKPSTKNYFYQRKDNKSGFRTDCKECHNQRSKKYYQQHSEKRKMDVKTYRKTIQGYIKALWKEILRRCNNIKRSNYKYYGGRGIKVKFTSFEDFYDYVMNELKADPRGLTIDRINNNGNYERGNIRFVTHAENCQNRRKSLKGKTK